MPSSRAVVIAIGMALCVGAFAPSARTTPAQVSRVGGFEQTQSWLRLANIHQSGTLDEPARQVAGWSQLAYMQVIDDMQLIRMLMVQAARQGTTGPTGPSALLGTSVELRGKRLKFDQLAPLLGLTPDQIGGEFSVRAIADLDSPARKAIAALMMRAALLHTDIAMAPPGELPASIGGRLTASAIQLRDGRESSVGNIAVHYSIAREAMALVIPAAAGTAVGKQWYFATLAYLQSERNYAALTPHLETARVTLPGEARAWLWSGVAYENLAAPAVQVAAEGSSARIEPPSILYARAEQFYRRALTTDPNCGECALHLGRVRQLSSHPEEAAPLLAQAESKVESPLQRYYAALFGGRAAESLNKIDDARKSYERAMGLYPQAQSPRLALAELAVRDADQAQAMSSVRTMFITAGTKRDNDPWWIYDVSLVLNWETLMAEMRKSAAQLTGSQ